LTWPRRKRPTQHPTFLPHDATR